MGTSEDCLKKTEERVLGPLLQIAAGKVCKSLQRPWALCPMTQSSKREGSWLNGDKPMGCREGEDSSQVLLGHLGGPSPWPRPLRCADAGSPFLCPFLRPSGSWLAPPLPSCATQRHTQPSGLTTSRLGAFGQ